MATIKINDAFFQEPRFRPPQVLRICKVDRDNLFDWHRRGLIPDARSGAKGRGHRRLYSVRDVIFINTFRILAEADAPLDEAARLATDAVEAVIAYFHLQGAVVRAGGQNDSSRIEALAALAARDRQQLQKTPDLIERSRSSDDSVSVTAILDVAARAAMAESVTTFDQLPDCVVVMYRVDGRWRHQWFGFWCGDPMPKAGLHGWMRSLNIETAIVLEISSVTLMLFTRILDELGVSGD